MKTKMRGNIKQAYVMEWDDVAAFDIILRKGRSAKYEVRANCADGATRTFVSLQELQDYDNSASRAIQTLRLEATGDSYLDRASIHFSDGIFSNIDFEANGEDSEVAEFDSSVRERIRELRPWYALFPEFSWVFGIVILVGGALGLYALYRIGTGTATKNSNLGLIALGVSWLGLLLDKAKEKFFPQSVIALGATDRIHRKREILRVAVLLGFVVNVVAGILVAVLFA